MGKFGVLKLKGVREKYSGSYTAIDGDSDNVKLTLTVPMNDYAEDLNENILDEIDTLDSQINGGNLSQSLVDAKTIERDALQDMIDNRLD